MILLLLCMFFTVVLMVPIVHLAFERGSAWAKFSLLTLSASAVMKFLATLLKVGACVLFGDCP